MTNLNTLVSDRIKIKAVGPWTVSCTLWDIDQSRFDRLLSVTTLSQGTHLPNGTSTYTNAKKGLSRVTIIADSSSVTIHCSRANLDKFEGAIAYVLLGLKHLPVICQYEITAVTLTRNKNAKYIKKMLRVGNLFWVVAEVDLPIIHKIIQTQP